MAQRHALTVLLSALLVGFAASGNAQAQDFSKSYTIPPGGNIRVTNVSGSVKITGYAGGSILAVGTREGRDQGCVQVEDNSDGEHIDLRVRYPERGSCNASINFVLQVPENVEYNFERISSVSGRVDIDNVTGRLRAESVSGGVGVHNVTGIVSASSVSGSLDVQISRVQGAGDMKFSSVSGSVNVKAPTELDADVEMSSISGSLQTDFPIEIQEQHYGPGRSARGHLGSGKRSLRITTVSGRVSLTHN